MCCVELARDRLLCTHLGSKGFLRREFSPLINPMALPRWWAPIRVKQLSVVATAHVKCKCKCRDGDDKHTWPLYIAFCSGLEHQDTKGADGSRYQSIYEPTEPSQPMMSDDVSDEDRPQHRELRPLLFSNSVWVL